MRLTANQILAAGPGFEAPGVDAFNPEPLARFTLLGIDFAITRIQAISWVVILLIIAFFVAAVRKPTLVPGRMQWMGESTYGFVRDGIVRDVIGRDGLRFAPYLATLFVFILMNNFMGVVPLADISPTAKIAVPTVLALISWVLYNWLGVKKHGLGGYLKSIAFPPGIPKAMYLLIAPLEIFSTLFVRPFTLAVRLFANMFAGHLLLLVFILGTIYLVNVGNFSVVFTPVSFIMAMIMTLFEFLVEALQAYVFVILTSAYIQQATADEH